MVHFAIKVVKSSVRPRFWFNLYFEINEIPLTSDLINYLRLLILYAGCNIKLIFISVFCLFFAFCMERISLKKWNPFLEKNTFSFKQQHTLSSSNWSCFTMSWGVCLLNANSSQQVSRVLTLIHFSFEHFNLKFTLRCCV